MPSKRAREGYLLIDHRAGGGMPGMPNLYESATITCSHCQRIIVLRPDRTRARGYCPKCDHYICDECTAVMHVTLECRPYKKLIDEIQKRNLPWRSVPSQS